MALERASEGFERYRLFKQLLGNTAMLGLVCFKFSASVLPFPFCFFESGLSQLICTRVFLGSDCELIPSYGQIRTERNHLGE